MKTFILGMILCANSFGATPTLGKVVGTMGLVEGFVYVDSKQVKQSSPIHEGSVIEVKKGHATVLLGKGSVFNIASDSKMVVSQFGVKPDGAEDAELDLKFGRTRALILNQGNEKKNIRVKARAATMGVRGTEIYVDSPRDTAKPIQFFTLEGKAEVRSEAGAPPVPVAQNQGVSATGVAHSASSAPAASATEVAPSTITVSEVKSEIKRSGLDPAPSTGGLPPPQAATQRGVPGSLSTTLGIGSLPPVMLDPVLDRGSPLTISPHFCNAATGVCY